MILKATRVFSASLGLFQNELQGFTIIIGILDGGAGATGDGRHAGGDHEDGEDGVHFLIILLTKMVNDLLGKVAVMDGG
jgi:hypothetical protein